MKISLFFKKLGLLLILLLAMINSFGQNINISQLLDRPVTKTVINGDTLLQRDLTDYLNFTQATSDDPNVAVLKDYFMRPHPSVSTTQKYFNQASAEFGVPVTLLMVIGQVENNWTQTGPTIDQGWGIMHLVKNNYCNTLGEASTLLEVSEQVLKDNAFQNIRGAAALISKYAGKKKKKFNKVEDWYPAVAKFSGLINKELRNMQAQTYYEVLKNGVTATTVWGETIIILPNSSININSNNKSSKKKHSVNLKSTDYSPALTNLAPSCNYASGRTHSIDTWVMHYVGTGTYAGAISWFLDCASDVSAHFVIRSSDGQITQCVSVANTAWHCGATSYPYNNSRSIGVEHEATSANPSLWNSTAMLQASANMACYFKDIYSFPTTQNTCPGICGHNYMPGTSTACPGGLPWSTWYTYFNACGSTIAPSNDNCPGTQLTVNSSCNYTSGTTIGATSTGFTSCSGSINDDDVFYYFNTGSNTSVTVQVNGLAQFDAAVQVLSGPCGTSMLQITNGCIDVNAHGELESRTFTGLSTNTNYYIRIGSYDAGTANQGDFQVCVYGSASCSVSVPTGSTVDENSGSTSFAVTSNGGSSWSVSESCSWLSCSPTSGTGNGNVTINYQANTTTSSRSCTITVSCGSTSDTYVITQDPPLACTVSVPTGSNVDYNSGSTSFAVTSNGSDTWSVSESCSWLSCSPTSGTGNGNVTITYQANSGTSSRTCTITVSCGSSTDTYILTQDPTPEPCSISVPTGSDVDNNSGSTSFAVTSNGTESWSVSESCSWLSCTPTSGTGNGNVTINYQANTTTSTRSCTITVSCGSSTDTYILNQDPTPECSVSVPNGSSVDYNLGSTSFAVTSNGFDTWTVSESCSWLSCSPTSGTGNGNVAINYLANPNPSSRSCTITVSCGNNTDTYTFVQGGTDPCTVSLNSSGTSVNENAGSTNFNVTSNGTEEWSVSESCNWLTCSPLSGTGNATVTINYDENTSSLRTCIITVNCGSNSDTYTLTQDGSSGVNENGIENFISIYPNPSNGNFTISFNSIDKSVCDFMVIDVLGRTVYEKQRNLAIGENKFEIKLGDIAKGLYFIRLQTETYIVSKKIIVK